MPDMRMEMSPKNKYYIEKERKYELVHFCRQYKKWKEALMDVQGWAIPPKGDKVNTGNTVIDPVARAAAIRQFYEDRLEMIERAAYEADPELADYILRGICYGITYDSFLIREKIPCSRDTYYDRRAKFLWILDKLRA